MRKIKSKREIYQLFFLECRVIEEASEEAMI